MMLCALSVFAITGHDWLPLPSIAEPACDMLWLLSSVCRQLAFRRNLFARTIRGLGDCALLCPQQSADLGAAAAGPTDERQCEDGGHGARRPHPRRP